MKRSKPKLPARIPAGRRVLAVVLVAGLGIISLLTSHATTPTTSLEAENGSVSCPAAANTNVNGASNSGAVTFGAGCGSSGTQTTNCAPPLSGKTDFASVETAVLNNTTSHLCGFPDITNSGVPANVALYTPTSNTVVPTAAQSCTPTYDGTHLPCDNWGWTFSGGGITINSANAVVDGIKLTNGGIDAATSSPAITGATIENSNIANATPDGGIVYFRYGNNNTVKYSTIHGIDDGATNSAEYAIQNVNESSLTVDHVFLYNCAECAAAGTGLSLTHSYLIVNATIPGSHYEDVYFAGGSFTVDNDTLFNLQEQTASIDTDPTITGMDVNNSLLLSGNNVLYTAGSTSTNVSITNNHFVGSYPEPFQPDDGAQWPSSGIWTGNVCDETGQPVVEENVWYNAHNQTPGQECF